MLGLKLNHVSKRGYRRWKFSIVEDSTFSQVMPDTQLIHLNGVRFVSLAHFKLQQFKSSRFFNRFYKNTINPFKRYHSCQGNNPGAGLYLSPGHVLPNERRRYIYNVFPHWLRLFSAPQINVRAQFPRGAFVKKIVNFVKIECSKYYSRENGKCIDLIQNIKWRCGSHIRRIQ